MSSPTTAAFARWTRPPGKSASWYAREVVCRVCAESFVVWVHAVGTIFFGHLFIFSPIIVALRTGRDDDYASNLFATRVFSSCVCFACASSVLHRTFWPMSEAVCRRTEKFAHCGVASAIAGTGFPLALLTLRPAMKAVYLCWLVSTCATARTTFILTRRALSTERRAIETLYVAWIVPVVGGIGVAVHGFSGFGVSAIFLPFLGVACAHVIAGVVLVRQKSPGVVRFTAHASALAATFAHWMLFFYNM